MARSTARVAAAKREQILEAAIARFARHSYEDTSLRAIAADVGVDAARVHRSFGSKEQLLAEAVRATAPPIERLLSGPRALLPFNFADEVLAHGAPRAVDDVDVLDIVVRSLTSREASGVLKDAIMADFIEPLARTMGPHAERRAALVLAMLLGVGVLRGVLHIEPLLDTRDGETRQLLVQAFRTLIGPSQDPAAGED
ncbi:TetR/AcrR family transcriptional regulator [Xanthobacter sediminis]